MPRIEQRELESFVADIAASLGAPEDIARDLAESLVAADLCGHSSHGSRLLPTKYVPDITEEKIDPAARPRIERDDGVFVTIDGQKAFGQIVARTAIDEGIAKAEEHGIGVVSLRNVSHIGRVGEWAERAAESGMSLVAFVSNPGSRWVSPPGSAQRRLSTNPIAIGLPTFDALPFPLVLDMATSQVPLNKIREQAAANEPLPDGWCVDKSGEYITDGAAYEDGIGSILPLGGLVTGHKGFGLAAMAELMAGNASDGSVSGMNDVLWGNHALFYVTDIERWTTRDALESRVTAFVDYIHETDFSGELPMPWATKGNRALVPGEAEHRTRESHRTDGVPLRESDVRTFRAFAAEQSLGDRVPTPFR